MGIIDTSYRLLANFNGADGSNVFVDSSPYNIQLSAAANAQIDTADSRFGGSSLLLDGTGDYVFAPNSVNWHFGTGNYLFETWMKFQSTSGTRRIVSCSTSDASYSWYICWINGTGIQVAHDSGANYTNFAWTAIINTWYHFRTKREDGVVRAFIDGTQIGSDWSNSTSVNSGHPLCIGSLGTYPDQWWQGWFDQVVLSDRIVDSGNFTPPTRPYGYVQPALFI